MLTVAAAVLVLALLLGTLLYAGQRGIAQQRAAKADGSFSRQFVWVEDDGTARELKPEETTHLNSEFSPGDIGGPHIKDSYTVRPGQRRAGFLLRSKLPQDVTIRA